jgi:glucose-6-phosphate 1-dehydrogenase
MTDRIDADAAELSDGLVLFGGGGDLALRMLFPSLCFLEAEGLLPPDMPILAAGRSAMDDEAFRALVRDALHRRAGEAAATGAADRLLARTYYIATDVTQPDDLKLLGARMRALGIGRPLFYLSVSPSLYSAICQGLLAAGLTGNGARVVMEKPIGRNLESSRVINDQVQAAFSEDRIFRIDHYLGKETVQNLIALRFANTLFEPLWNNLTIDHVQITIAETQGVGDRWPYYDEYGAMGDMVQNHMMQLLCLVAMEPPSDLAPDSVRNEKVKVLRSLRPIGRAEVAQNVVRGQYTKGVVAGQQTPGYLEEKGADSDTETFVAIQAHIDNWRWAGVPFFLRTGKRMAEGQRIISIAFREPPKSMFPTNSGVGAQGPDHLTFDLADASKVSLSFYGKRPGPGMRLDKQSLQFSMHDTGLAGEVLEAYERLLLDGMRGDHTLFTTAEGIERLWEVSQPLIENPPPVRLYSPDSWGPKSIHQLIAPHAWRLPFERAWRSPNPSGG